MEENRGRGGGGLGTGRLTACGEQDAGAAGRRTHDFPSASCILNVAGNQSESHLKVPQRPPGSNLPRADKETKSRKLGALLEV